MAPVRTLTSVLLPAPFAPIRAWTSPGRTASDADRSARTAPYCFATPVASSSSSVMTSSDPWLAWAAVWHGDAGRGRHPRDVTTNGWWRSALAGAFAGDELVLGIRGPILDRQAEGPRLRKLRIGCSRERSLALGSVVPPDLGRDMDGGALGLLAIEDLGREDDA